VGGFVVYVEVGVVGFQGFDFWVVADHDVGVVGILEGVVLVVVFAVSRRTWVGIEFNLSMDVPTGEAMLVLVNSH
jgi:hypothetical protein